MGQSLVAYHLLGLGLGLVLTVVYQHIVPLSLAHPVTMAPQMNMAQVLGIIRSSPPPVFPEALLVVLAASPLARREPIIF